MRLFKRLVSAVLVTTMVASIFTGIAPPGSVLDTSTTAEAITNSTIGNNLSNATDSKLPAMKESLDKAKTNGFLTPSKYNELMTTFKSLETKYANDTVLRYKKDKNGNPTNEIVEYNGLVFLTWTSWDTKASSGIRWRTEKYWVSPEKLTNVGTATNPDYHIDEKSDGFWLTMYSWTINENTSAGKTHTRYVVCLNELYKKMNKSDSGFTTKNGKTTMYLSARVRTVSVNSKTGVATPRKTYITKLCYWKIAEGWRDPSTFKDHYNIAYTIDNLSYKDLTVHYIVKNSQQLVKKKVTEEKVAEPVTLKKVPAGVYKIGDDISYNKGKSTKNVYKDVIETDGKKYVISGFYMLSDDNLKAKNLDNQKQRFAASGTAKASMDDTKKVQITKNSKVPTDTAYPRLSKWSYSEFKKAVKKSKFTMPQENMHLYLEYTEATDTQDITIKYQYQAYEDGKYVWKTVDTEKITNYKKDTYKRLLFRVSNTYAKTGNL
jgi:hypothetical protein